VRWSVVLLAVAIIIDAIVGERGLLAMLRAREQYEQNEMAIQQQRAENERLREEADRLLKDPAALEELARGELGLMRPGEKVFIVKDRTPPAAR
jgi:cell division protein FtsB